MEIDLSLHYFNFRLSFYEPLIESTSVNVCYKSDDNNKEIKIKTGKQSALNFNLSTAMFENVVICISYFNEAFARYYGGEAKNIQHKNAHSRLEVLQNKQEYMYTLENLTGEEISVSSNELEEITVRHEEKVVLDFDVHQVEGFNRNSFDSKSDRQRNRDSVKQSYYPRSPYRVDWYRIEHNVSKGSKKLNIFIPKM